MELWEASATQKQVALHLNTLHYHWGQEKGEIKRRNDIQEYKNVGFPLTQNVSKFLKTFMQGYEETCTHADTEFTEAIEPNNT